MTATGWFPPPSSSRCPSCDGPVEEHRCRSCGLDLRGQAASTLWYLDNELHRLSGQRSAVLTQVRRSSEAPARPPAAAPRRPAPTMTVPPDRPGVPPTDATPPQQPRPPLPPHEPEATSVDVQNVLLGLGAFLLAVAAVVFVTVTWSRLSATVQGLVLLGLTAATAVGTSALHRKGLKATAEAVGTVAVILALVDVHAARLALAPSSEPLLFWSFSTLVVAAAAAGFSRLVPLLSARISAAVLVQLAVPMFVVGVGAGTLPLALCLLAQAAVLAIVLAVVLPGRNGATELVFGLGGATAWFAGTVLAVGRLIDAWSIAPLAPAGAVLAAGLVAALVGWWWEDGRRACLGAATALGLVALAGATHASLSGQALVLVVGFVSAAVLAVAVYADRQEDVDGSWIDGSLVVASIVSFASLVPLAIPLGEALVACFPKSGLWHGDLASHTRTALATGHAWSGSGVTAWFLALAALVAAAASPWRLGSGSLRPEGRSPGTPLRPWLTAAWFAIAIPIAPLLVNASVGWAVAWLLGATVVTVVVLVAAPARPVQAWIVLAAAAVPAAGWALRAPWTTVAALATFAVLAGLITWRGRPERSTLPAGAVVTTALAVILVPVVQRASGGSVVAAWFGLAVAGIAASGLGWVFDLRLPAVKPARTLPPPPGEVGPWRPVVAREQVLRWAAMAVEATSGALAGFGLLCAASLGTPDQVSVALALFTVATAAHAVRPGRRPLLFAAACGALVLVWQRLALADVHAVEAYALPAAAALLAIGWWLRDRAESSWAWCGPGLVAGFLPTTLVAIHDPGLVRSLGAIVAAAAVVLIGARARLQAPVALGAAVLVTIGLRQLGPVVGHLPRWVLFATAGSILIAVGATYERRRLGLMRLSDHIRAMQ